MNSFRCELKTCKISFQIVDEFSYCLTSLKVRYVWIGNLLKLMLECFNACLTSLIYFKIELIQIYVFIQNGIHDIFLMPNISSIKLHKGLRRERELKIDMAYIELWIKKNLKRRERKVLYSYSHARFLSNMPPTREVESCGVIHCVAWLVLACFWMLVDFSFYLHRNGIALLSNE